MKEYYIFLFPQTVPQCFSDDEHFLDQFVTYDRQYKAIRRRDAHIAGKMHHGKGKLMKSLQCFITLGQRVV